MGSLDFGKITTIVIAFFIVTFFFGDKLLFWYKHKEDLQFSLSKMVYTKADFNTLEEVDRQAILDEIASVCIRKHHEDKLSCSDTAYWLANSLEKDGVDVDLAIDWMKPCSDACETGKYDPAVYEEVNPVSGKKIDKSTKDTEPTKWIWDN